MPPRISRLVNDVKAVVPMNQEYIKGTGTGNKFDAIVEGRRTQTTRNNQYDVAAINRLQPNDTIAITAPDGRIQLAQVTGKGQVDPEIFAGNPQAIANYNAAEGGVGPYANVTLMGSFKPKVIPLDQPFGTSPYKTNALPGSSQTLSYQPIGEPFQPDVIPENIQSKLNQRNNTEQFSDTGLYKDSYFDWQDSPFNAQSGKSPYFSGESATYPREAAAGLNRIVLDGNNYPSEVIWNKDATTGEAVPFVRQGKLGEQMLLRDRDPEGYTMFMGNANIPSYVQNNSKQHRRFRLDSEPEYYDGKKWKFASGGYTVYQNNAIPVVPVQIPSRQMQSPDAATIGINRAMAEGSGRDNPLDIYRGNLNEPGLDAIEAVARAGGSGTYINPGYNTALEDIDTWNRIQRQQTQSQGMAEMDKRLRGEYVEDRGSTPLTYSEQGYLTYGKGDLNSPAPAIGDFYEPVAQSKIARLVGEAPRNIQRIPGSGVAPRYQYSNVNEFGVATGAVIDESKYGPAFNLEYRRPPVYLSDKVVEPQTFDRYDTDVSAYGKPIEYLAESIRNPIAGQQRLPRGRWMGGGLNAKYNDRSSDSTVDALNSDYKIATPRGTAFVPMQQNPELIPGTNLTLREDYIEPVVPFERQYTIRETGNVIPGQDPGVIEGAYLPATTVRGGEETRGYIPFLQGKTAEAQLVLDANPELASRYEEGKILNEHLADAAIEVAGRKYPLTPEATTTEYLPSKKQLEEQSKSRYGKRRVFEDGDIDYFGAGPSEADLMAIEGERTGRGFDVEDDLLNRYSSLAKKSREVYADPNIEPTDALGAIAERERSLNRINAAIANREGSEYNGIYFPPSPTAAEALDNTNTLRGSIIGTRYGGGELPSGVSSDLRLLRNKGMGSKESPQRRTFSRFVNEDEANRIAQSQLVGTADREYINPSDLNFLTTDAAPERILTTDELRQQQQLIADDLERAKKAYTGLMSLEPQNEIEIVTPGDNTLAAQMQQLGLQVQQKGERMISRGSLPLGLPGDNIPNLPVKYNSREVIDPELENIYQTGQMELRQPFYQRPEFYVPPYPRNAAMETDIQNALMSLKPSPKINLALRGAEGTNIDPGTAYFSPYGLIDASELASRQVPATRYSKLASQEIPVNLFYDDRISSGKLNQLELADDNRFAENLAIRQMYESAPKQYGDILGNMIEQGQLSDRSQILANRWNRNEPVRLSDVVTVRQMPQQGQAQQQYPPIKPPMQAQASRVPQQNTYDSPDDAWFDAPNIDYGFAAQEPYYDVAATPVVEPVQQPSGRRPDPFKGEVLFEQTAVPNFATGENLQTPPERRRNYTPLVVGGGIFGTGLLGNIYQQDQERKRIEQQRMMQQGY